MPRSVGDTTAPPHGEVSGEVAAHHDDAGIGRAARARATVKLRKSRVPPDAPDGAADRVLAQVTGGEEAPPHSPQRCGPSARCAVGARVPAARPAPWRPAAWLRIERPELVVAEEDFGLPAFRTVSPSATVCRSHTARDTSRTVRHRAGKPSLMRHHFPVGMPPAFAAASSAAIRGTEMERGPGGDCVPLCAVRSRGDDSSAPRPEMSITSVGPRTGAARTGGVGRPLVRRGMSVSPCRLSAQSRSASSWFPRCGASRDSGRPRLAFSGAATGPPPARRPRRARRRTPRTPRTRAPAPAPVRAAA